MSAEKSPIRYFNRQNIYLIISGLLFSFFLFSLHKKNFEKPRSTILYAADGTLLSGMIASDGQWRFPQRDTVPYKFRSALLMFEDRHFYDHSGVYLPSLFRALVQNISSKKIVSGASTITMQTIRLSRDNPSRTVSEKIMEMIRALRLEWKYDKEEILALYASNAPFGGNVVGLDAASWRYYGRSPEQLSWAESATLAVLPNAPSLIFPGKNQQRLLMKRNHLLLMLHEEGIIDDETLSLSLSEPLPNKPFPLPQKAPHLLHTLSSKNGQGKNYTTTINHNLQEQCSTLLQQRVSQLESNFIHNAAVLVVEVRTGNVVAYIGNSNDAMNRFGNMVDVIRSPRSTGSILKPFLYAAMLKDGLILPNTLVADIPMQFDGFSPQNYSETFDGAVPASRALSRSLNIPSVVMLKDYGYQRFYHLLKKTGFTNFTQPADHYGLSLILGGGEATLWDITHAYAGMSRTLNLYHESNGKYFDDAYSLQNVIEREEEKEHLTDAFPAYDAGSIWCTYKALLEVNRPETELGWEVYSSSSPIAWKTGTSFGNRDAWAVGTTPDYVVGVWVGNADGQGRPTLTGVTAAAPLLFDIFSLLPHSRWFSPPYDAMEKIPVCHESGMRKGENCIHVDSVFVPSTGLNSASCKYHNRIFTDENSTVRLSESCAHENMIAQSWFVLPPVQEYFYKSRHPEYKPLPPFAPGCGEEESLPIGLIYPKSDARIFIPRGLDGIYEKVVLEATHRDANAILYWHLNGEYLGETRVIHHFEIHPQPGRHLLTITDQNGRSLFRYVEFIGKN